MFTAANDNTPGNVMVIEGEALTKFAAKLDSYLAGIKRFKVGESYWTRSACDSDCIFRFKIVARSATTVTIEDARGKRTRRSVKVSGTEEYCLPMGRYSMAPVISAGKQG